MMFIYLFLKHFILDLFVDMHLHCNAINVLNELIHNFYIFLKESIESVYSNLKLLKIDQFFSNIPNGPRELPLCFEKDHIIVYFYKMIMDLNPKIRRPFSGEEIFAEWMLRKFPLEKGATVLLDASSPTPEDILSKSSEILNLKEVQNIRKENRRLVVKLVNDVSKLCVFCKEKGIYDKKEVITFILNVMHDHIKGIKCFNDIDLHSYGLGESFLFDYLVIILRDAISVSI